MERRRRTRWRGWRTTRTTASRRSRSSRFEKSADSLLGNKATYLNLQRIGSVPAQAAIVMGLQSKNAGIRATAAESCMHASYGKASADEMARLAHDENDRVAAQSLVSL